MEEAGKPAEEADVYTDKIAKFVPAEVLAFFLPSVSKFADQGDFWVGFIVVVGALATGVYLWQRATTLKPEKQPLPHFYALAIFAFVMWALGSSGTVAKVIGLNPDLGAALLGLTVFALPGIDFVLARTLPYKPAR
jgi:hypothetical protein